MNYEPLTPPRFEARLKEGVYKGLTGARRAIGKTNWSKKDKESAQVLCEKHFASGGKTASSGAPKVAKKLGRPPKAVAKTRGRKRVQSSAPPPATPQVPQPRLTATPKRSPVVSEGDATPPGPNVEQETTRQNAAMGIISALRNAGKLDPWEQRTYRVATLEYYENMSAATRRVWEASSFDIPPIPAPPGSVPGDDEKTNPRLSDDVVTAPAGARIPVTNGGQALEEMAERVRQGAAAIAASHGVPTV